ncbi:universal stress protein [Paraburkholderia hospita]|uniref:universal stress protein n=1 Tax=Paraburkholderia hospita TaxID=169430 RepID=UPI000B3413BB|nr:hypothetical protein CA603_07770 [Paraburkholderia hospita]
MASYKSILVQLDACAAAQTRLEFALRIAEHFDAHLTGLLALFTIASAAFYAITDSAKYVAEHEKRCAESNRVLERLFKAEAARLSVPAEWLSTVNEETYAALQKQGSLADLIVAGQRNNKDPESCIDEQFVENLVLSAGRPVLIVPYAGIFPAVGTRVLVAWDGSREATRAVHDALPFIACAQQTTIVTVNSLEGEPPARRAPGAELAVRLARHGANVATDDIEGMRGVTASPFNASPCGRACRPLDLSWCVATSAFVARSAFSSQVS